MSERDDRLRKLEPKLGRKNADKLWLAAKALSGLRKHIDAYVGFQSYRQLQDTYRSQKVLLPPPSSEELRGPITVGKVMYDGQCHGVLGLHPNELAHTAFIGATGEGKTTAAFRLARSLLENGYKVWCLDSKRSWRSLLAYVPESRVGIYTPLRAESPFAMNFMIPPEGVRRVFPCHLVPTTSPGPLPIDTNKAGGRA